jgi:ribose 1,5-bisphosphokinase PhnN
MSDQAKSGSTARRELAKIRRRWEKLELVHLRSHAAELATKLEEAQDELERVKTALVHAEQWCESWRDDCLRMMEDEAERHSGTIGLAKDGSLHIISAQAGGAA